MGKAITLAIVAAALALAAPLAAHAAGLGKLTVLSPLGQPLNAEIEIVALRPGEEESLVARVAAPDAFAAAGVEMSHVLSSMRFTVERRGTQRVLRVRTVQPVNEPFVEFLVELQWATGRLVREYTFLLDPPEYKGREAVAAAPSPTPKPAAPVQEAKPAAAPSTVEAKPLEPAPAAPVITPAPSAEPAKEPAKEAAQEPAKEAAQEPAKEPAKEAAKPEAEAKTHEVKKGDTLGAIARANLPPGVSLNQMLIALYRANQDAFIRENVNLVRAGRILAIPTAEQVSAVAADEANAIVRTHMAEFREYRSRLAAVPTPAEATPGQREGAGRIEPKPEAPKPAPQDQVRLSKVDPQKPGAAARADDLAARERALKEAQSRITDLEKNVSDLQKLLELKNQQLAELEKRAAAKPAPAPAPAAPAPAPARKAPEKPAAEASKPAPPPVVAKAPEKPAAEAPKPAAPAPAAKAPEAAKAPDKPKPAPKPAAKPAPKGPPPPEPSLLDEFLANPVALAGLGGVVLLLLAYGVWAWRKKKAVQAKFHDSVIGAAAAGAAAGASISEPTLGGSTPPAVQPAASQPPAAMAAEEVDPIAEADVYMAYGRDSQAEEILKEALQKDSSRAPVHSKLLEIYAKRKDAKAFEQTALKLKNVTNGTGPEWEKAAALGASIDPQNGLYAGATPAAAAAAPAAAAPAAPAPTLDFDIGGAGQTAAPAPDLPLEAAPKQAAAEAPLDFDITGAPQKKDVSVDETMVAPAGPDKSGGLDFNLDLGATQQIKPAAAAPAAPAAPAADPGLSFDLNLDLGTEKKAEEPKAAPAADLSAISFDLGSPADTTAAAAGTDPKWQEIATKLDLAKAYEEMGDKAGAKELLNEVMKDGDAAQKGQAQQLLAKLG